MTSAVRQRYSSPRRFPWVNSMSYLAGSWCYRLQHHDTRQARKSRGQSHQHVMRNHSPIVPEPMLSMSHPTDQRNPRDYKAPSAPLTPPQRSMDPYFSARNPHVVIMGPCKHSRGSANPRPRTEKLRTPRVGDSRDI